MDLRYHRPSEYDRGVVVHSKCTMRSMRLSRCERDYVGDDGFYFFFLFLWWWHNDNEYERFELNRVKGMPLSSTLIKPESVLRRFLGVFRPRVAINKGVGTKVDFRSSKSESLSSGLFHVRVLVRLRLTPRGRCTCLSGEATKKCWPKSHH